MATFPYAAAYSDGTPYAVIPSGSTVVNVSSSSALTTAITNAAPGARIVLASGTYSGAFTITGKSGTSSAGISIEAATTGGAVFASGSTFTINNSSYVTLRGLSLPYELSSGSVIQFRGAVNRARVTRCLFGPTSVGSPGTNKAPFVFIADKSQHVRVDHCTLRNKANPGNAIVVDGDRTVSPEQVCKYIRIDHNLITNIRPEVDNEKEPVRFGWSGQSKSHSYSVVERNRFEACIAEPEVISVKASSVRVSGNVIWRCIGGPVYRHGTNGIMSDNYVIDGAQTFGTTIGSGGFRFYDAGHEVSYNYVQGVYGGNFQGPLLLDTGDAEGSSTNLSAHWRVVSALVERNVLIGNTEGIRIGDNYNSAPTNCTIRDNLVAQAGTGQAITQLIAPASSTLANNTYYATPGAGGFAQDSASVWRKTGYGPRLTFLQAGDVGASGDLSDADGTGALVSGGPGPGPDPTPPPPTDTTTAAGRYGWGAPLAISDEFNYTGPPDPAKWKLPGADWAGHNGNGTRDPERMTVQDGRLIMTGLANGSTGWMQHKFDQQYGRWEGRCRSRNTASSNGNQYHPLFLIWPTSNSRQQDGEYDFLENSKPGDDHAGAFLHYPHPGTTVVQQIHFERANTDLTQWHNFALEWTPDFLKLYCDGELWGTASGGANSVRRNIQDMPSGHGTIQLDNFNGTNQTPAVFEVEWYRVYTLTPSAPPPGALTVTASGIPSGQAFGVPTVTGAEPGSPTGTHATLLGTTDTVLPFTLGYTVGEGGPAPAGAQTVSAAGRIPSGQAFGLPLFSVADGPQDVRALAIDSAAAFGRPTVAAAPPPPTAPGGVLVPAVYAVDRAGKLTPLPAWTRLNVDPVRNSMGAFTIDYPAGAAGFSALADGVSAHPLRALEVRIWLGGSQEGALGGWLTNKAGDDLTPGSSWSFTGHFHEWLLSKALIAPQTRNEANPKGELRFTAATAGLVLSTIMDQAQARGALPLVTRDFTVTHDSSGAPWPQTVSSLVFAPKTTVAQAADKLVELGMLEYELTAARVWRAYAAGTRGVDRTTGLTPLTFAHAVNLTQHSRRESAKDAGTAVLAAGSEGFYSWAESATAVAELGWRAEVAVDAGQLQSETAVQAYAATHLEAVRNGTAEFVGEVEFATGVPLPIINWGIGDWAYTWVGNKRRRLRIAQVGLEFAQGVPPRGTVALNDLITDKVAALYRRLNAISAGDAIVGTSVPTTGGAGDDFIPPSAPTGLTVRSDTAYRVPGETATLALVEAGWAPVLTDAYADVVTASKAEAAALIAERLRFGQPTLEDWTWENAPEVVTAHNDLLLLDFVAEYDPPSRPANLSPEAQEWLRTYGDTHAGQGAVTGDVDHYRLQYVYLGAQQLSDPTVPPGTGEEPPQDLALPDDADWIEPDGSPTRSTSLAWGNIEGGRSLGVRVCAVDRADNQGLWSEVVAVDTAVDDQPPPTPSRPTVATWFRTMDITWDGKGSAGEDMLAAAPDFASGGGLEVHIAEGIDFTPDRPLGVDGRVDLSLSTTYKATLYAAGTWNVADLTIGVTYFARFVAVDRSGNASPPSETSDGVLPKQLVNIDYGPGTIDRVQIRQGAIGSAEIGQLAVNDAHIDNINVGKLRAGTMTAQVTVSGRFQTPTVNGNRLEFDNAGIRLFQGSTVIGHWQVSDASMLVTGTYLSGLSGERINILPNGTIRIYGAAGVEFGEMANDGGIWKATSQPDANGRRSRIDFAPNQFLARYGTETIVRSSFSTGETYGVLTAGVVGTRVDRRFAPTDGTVFRAFWTHSTNGLPSGDISASVLHYLYTDSRAAITAPLNDIGVRFGGGPSAGTGRVYITDGQGIDSGDSTMRHLTCRSVTETSSEKTKRDIGPVADALPAGHRPRDLVRQVQAKSWKPREYDLPARRVKINEVIEETIPATPPDQVPTRIGLIAEELEAVAPMLVHRVGTDGQLLTVAPMEIAAVAWSAAGEAHDEIDALTARLAAIEARLAELPPKEPNA